MSRTVLSHAAPAAVLTALVLIPFLGKAFTVDDTVFLRQAEHALADPLHPTAFDMVWGDVPARVSPTSGTAMAWLLVPAILAGGSEPVAHLTQLAMLVLALVATVSLGIRLGLAPRWAAAAGLLLAATPASLGMAGTAMADVPAMALGVSGLERLVAWKQERRLHQAVLAAVLLGLAPMARPHLLLASGVGALLLAGDFLEPRARREGGWRPWAPLPAALLVTALLLFLTRDPSPAAAGLLAATGRTSALDRVPTNVVAFSIHWVLALPLALPWTLLRPLPLLRRWWVLILATAILGGLIWLGRELPPHPTRYRYAPIAGLGAAVLVDVLADGWRRRDATQVALGVWLLVALAAAPYFQVPSKYLLASAPASALLVARELSRRGGRAAQAILGLTCALGVALGVAILRADAAFAGLGRRAAASLIGPQVAAGRSVWFTAHWGFQWYAEKAGGRAVTLTPPYPARGDLVVVSRNSEAGNRNQLALGRLRLRPVGVYEDRTPGGRLMADGAGFYANGWGYLPWTWGEGPLDGFLVLEVE